MVKIVNRSVVESPDNTGFLRFRIQVEVSSRDESLDYWIDFPEDLRGDLSSDGNWEAVLLLPLGAYFNEPIIVEAAVDRQLHDNLKGVLQVWNSWFKEFNTVDIELTTIANSDKLNVAPELNRKTLSCFSGGIDSLFTLARHHQQVLGDGDAVIDELMSIAGFNTGFTDIDHMIGHLSPIAERFGMRLIPIVTNIRYGAHPFETPYSNKDWMCSVAHGAMLALIPHLFSRRYKELLVPATHGYDSLIPWGSHPLTDVLFGSADLLIKHEGMTFSRFERTRFLATSDLALELMHVCWKDYKEGNCSQCEKCTRTMLSLDLVGAKDRSRAFDWDCYSADLIMRTWLIDENAANYYKELLVESQKLGRDDLVYAIKMCIQNSVQRRRWFAVKKYVRAVMETNPLTRLAWKGLRVLRAGNGALS